jgi:coproporphyrinogen III oxidase-like Fe-S oxidoreductase
MKKIGFTIGHNESIHVHSEKNFLKFIRFLKKSGIRLDNIDFNLKNLVTDYQMIIVGAPESEFSDFELQYLRDYVMDGGNLFIILKYGGDRKLGTNMSRLFRDVLPKDDILFSDSNFFKSEYRPIIDVDIQNNFMQFSGPIVYDGGCTFTINNTVDLAVYPHDSCYSKLMPRWVSNTYSGEKSVNYGAIFVYNRIGKGSVLYWGGRWSFSDEMFNEYGNSSLFRKLIVLLLGQDVFVLNVDKRMKQTQRHRLLHGFPMPEANQFITGSPLNKLSGFDIDPNKELALGIICHPMCNPQVTGCGYCPFPHENLNANRMEKSISTVIDEIDALKKYQPAIINRRISSLYFGGGTANLTKPKLFDQLCKNLIQKLQIDRNTEITLEGAPAYFVDSEKKELLRIMRKHFHDSDLRISLGVQTFDEQILHLAGRSKMNRPGSVEDAFRFARDLGFRVSADFLFNLPKRDDFHFIKKDLEKAIDLQLEHICWYHLVAEENMSTEWSNDHSILKSLPNKELALKNWLLLYNELRNSGYTPLTVTDFQLVDSNGYYQYEEDLRNPEKIDWLGLGSYSISLLTNPSFSKAIKFLNPNNLDEYIHRQQQYGIPWNSEFVLSPYDLRLYWLTRKIKGIKISTYEYQALFGSSLHQDFEHELKSLSDHDLITENNGNYELTPKGFFYADTIAGHFSWMRVNELVSRGFQGRVVKKRNDGTYVEHRYNGERWENSSINHFMG